MARQKAKYYVVTLLESDGAELGSAVNWDVQIFEGQKEALKLIEKRLDSGEFSPADLILIKGNQLTFEAKRKVTVQLVMESESTPEEDALLKKVNDLLDEEHSVGWDDSEHDDDEDDLVEEEDDLVEEEDLSDLPL